MNNCEILIECIKGFMFDDEREVKNDMGFSHGLKFVDWCEYKNGFVFSDRDGNVYNLEITEETQMH